MAILPNNIYAFNAIEGTVHKKEDCGELIAYDGEPQQTSYVEWNGYPAYRTQRDSIGAENGDYAVTVKMADTKAPLWRIISNGYPYQDPETIGVKTKEEAYTATQHAIYLYTEGDWNFSRYSAIGDQENGPGARTLKAIEKLLKKGIEGTDTNQKKDLHI